MSGRRARWAHPSGGCSGASPYPWRSAPILAATALAFARSLGDFGATLMVAGNIPGKHADHGASPFTTRSNRATDARAHAGAGDLRRSAGDSDAGQSPGADGDTMIQARIRKNFPPRPDSAGFSLDLEFQAAGRRHGAVRAQRLGQNPDARFHRRLRASGRRPHSAGRRHPIRRRHRRSSVRRRRATAAMCSRTTRCFRT